MVATGCMKCVKYTIFFFNFLFLLAGIAMIVIGAIALSTVRQYDTGVGASGAAIFILVIGGIIFIVAFFGCCGAVKENECLLKTFGVLMIIVLICTIAAVIAAFVMSNKTQTLLTSVMSSYMLNYPEDKVALKFWDELQKNEHCCGTKSYADWRNNTVLSAKSAVPDSCCKNITTDCGKGMVNNSTSTNMLLLSPIVNQTIYTEGCLPKLTEQFKNGLLYVGAVAIVVAILQVLGIILAFSLAQAIHKGYNVV